MAYQASDKTAIDLAITDFIAGNRKDSVKFRDGREVSFAKVTLPDLQAIRTKIYNEVNSANRVRTSVFRTSKGL